MLPIGSIKIKHGISFHCYADDTQTYLPVKKDSSSLGPLFACLNDPKMWLDLNFLHLNKSKTEIIVFAPSNMNGSRELDLGPLFIHGKPIVKHLGVLFDESLKFDKQINAVVRSAFLQLRTLTKVKPFLSHYKRE